MSSSNLVWLILLLIQMTGLGITVATLGFGYDKATRDKTGLISAVERNHLIGWLALGMGLFSIGLLFGDANWLQKSASVGITFILGWIAWQSK